MAVPHVRFDAVGDFKKFLATYFIAKSAQIIGNFWAVLKNMKTTETLFFNRVE